MKKLKMDSEIIVYIVIVVIVGFFIFFLPEIDQALRNFWRSF